ncbi:hypothetical protein Q5752_005544 [Cryptotrichosporon argae]
MSAADGGAALPPMMRKARAEGDIGSVFASLTGEAEQPLEPRFLDLKREIIGDAANQARLVDSWARLTARLAQRADEVARKKQAVIPTVAYDALVAGDAAAVDVIKACGTAVVTGVVSEQQALDWLDEIRDYVRANPQVRGFPADDKQVYEVYWSKPQLAARAHPRSLAAQRALLGLFSSGPADEVSLATPLTYADRLRIRQPGDARFALGPHMDGGSVERWEDAAYRAVYATILAGDWEAYDPWQIGARALANQNLYDGPGSVSVFRAFQGWTSLSHTGPGEGTLRVYPFIRESTAYTLLRPLFRAKQSAAELARDAYLNPANWELDLSTSAFPNSPPGRGQEQSEHTHPHLDLARSMVSLPPVAPGDQAWWHGDAIHAVEPAHTGAGPSAVLYIPSVPLTRINAQYVRDQRAFFEQGRPAPDFPGGQGESSFVGRGTPDDISGNEARVAMSLQPFDVDGELTPGERAIRQQANKIFGF